MKIELVTMSGESDKRLVMNGPGAIARVFSIGAGWQQIRVGIRMSIVDLNVAYFYATAYLGLMSNPNSGVTNGPHTSSTSNFLGMQLGTPSTWNRQAGPPPCYNNIWSGMGTKIGGTASFGNWDNKPGIGVKDYCRSVYYVHFTRGTDGSTNWGVGFVYPYSLYGGKYDFSKDMFILGMKSGFGLSGGSITVGCRDALNTAAGTTVAGTGAFSSNNINESVNGPLNALVFAAAFTNPAVHISDVAWAAIT